MMGDKIRCENCGRVLATEIYQSLLYAGGLVIREVHGACDRCGHGFHYSVADKRLKQIIEQRGIETDAIR